MKARYIFRGGNWSQPQDRFIWSLSALTICNFRGARVSSKETPMTNNLDAAIKWASERKRPCRVIDTETGKIVFENDAPHRT